MNMKDWELFKKIEEERYLYKLEEKGKEQYLLTNIVCPKCSKGNLCLRKKAFIISTEYVKYMDKYKCFTCGFEDYIENYGMRGIELQEGG